MELVGDGDIAGWTAAAEDHAARWVEGQGFKGRPETICAIPDGAGGIARVLVGHDPAAGPEQAPWRLATAATTLPAGRYALPEALTGHEAIVAALGWALAQYRFDRYRTIDQPTRQLVITDATCREQAIRQAEAIFLVRDLVSTPANDMGPPALAEAAEALADAHGANIRIVTGESLVDGENFPAIHAVGRASADAPRLIDLTWGNETDPRVTLVGKGVCFDSGGLNIKGATGMRVMKKDMGGAAHVLGLAKLIMASGLPVRLRVLIPAVENAISGSAFRPGDILNTRKGLTVEVGNTDAEGRLVLCDALALGDEESPGLMVDFATLTGAARIALGGDVAPFYTGDDTLAAALAKAAETTGDPLWRMPLWAPYNKELESPIADIANVSESPFAGSITAALFLQRFVEKAAAWVHLDVYAWNQKPRPGRPVGGEAMGLRAVFAAIADRFGGTGDR